MTTSLQQSSNYYTCNILNNKDHYCPLLWLGLRLGLERGLDFALGFESAVTLPLINDIWNNERRYCLVLWLCLGIGLELGLGFELGFELAITLALIVSRKKHDCRTSKEAPTKKRNYNKERKQEARIRRWNVPTPKPVPSYGLGKGVNQINQSAEFVAQKIDEYLRLSSIDAIFDSENSEATCKTSDFLHFKIFLYAGPAGSTYVEMMRMSGCGFTFMKERGNIMNAAKGIQPKQNYSSTMGSNNIEIPPSFLKSYVPPSQSDLENMLHRASNKLDSRKSETTLFILRNLVALATPDEFVPENTNQMAALIMQNKNNIRDRILSIYMGQVSSMDDDEISEQICDASLTVLTYSILSIYEDN